MYRMRQGKKGLILLEIFLVDQFLKFLAVRLNLAVINKGIAFGLFKSFQNYPLLILAILIIGLFLFLLAVCKLLAHRDGKKIFYLALVLTGGLSNLLDRWIYGGVVDYLHLPRLPSFNLADLAINIGFVVLFYQAVF